MFVDAREVEFGAVVKTDVCVIGGGMAGLTVARELDRCGLDVCLLESGGLAADRATRGLSRGEDVGLPSCIAEGDRSRFLGGGSNMWNGWCRPLEDEDFRPRHWAPYSGRPIGKAELQSYYSRAQAVLGLGPANYDLDHWVSRLGRTDVRRLPLSPERITDTMSQFTFPTSFASLYHKELDRSTRLRVFLYANVVEIETDQAGIGARRAVILSLRGRKMFVSARVFVLAAGAIENARILLASNRVRRAGLGNNYDLVGRYFMDHPTFVSGDVRFSDAWRSNPLYDERFNRSDPRLSVEGTCFAAQCQVTPTVRRQEGLLNAQVWFSSVYAGEHPIVVRALDRLKRKLFDQDLPEDRVIDQLLQLAAHPKETVQVAVARWFRLRQLVRGVRVRALVEPMPDPESRVTLGEDQDELGMRRVRVNWRLDTRVQRTCDRTLAILAEELERAGVARVVLGPSIEGRQWDTDGGMVPNRHYLGTTRMHDSPRFGVVDRDGLVHGLRNVFVTGGSVFPTAGASPPALTVVALALRLADHLVKELKPGPARI